MSYIRCSLTGEVPDKPVMNPRDSRVYEESNLKKYLNYSTADPFNLEKGIREEDMVAVERGGYHETEEEMYENYIRSLKAFNSIALKDLDVGEMGVLSNIGDFTKEDASTLEKQEYLKRFGAESIFSKILSKKVKPSSQLVLQSTKFTLKSLQTHFEQKELEKSTLQKKISTLKREISKMIFDRRAFTNLYSDQKAEIEKIRAETNRLRAQLGTRLDTEIPLELKSKMRELTEKKMLQIRTQSKKTRQRLKKTRREIRDEILAEPEYVNRGGVELGLDVESNMYPATVEVGRVVDLDFEVLRVVDGGNGVWFVVWGSDGCLRMMDWGSLRVLGQIRVNVMKRIDYVFLNGKYQGSEGDKDGEIFLLTENEILTFWYEHETGKMKLTTRTKTKIFRNCELVEKHPVKDIVYILNSDFRVVYSLKKNEELGRYFSSQAKPAFKIHPDGSLYLKIKQKPADRTEKASKSENNDKPSLPIPETEKEISELAAYSCFTNKLQASFADERFSGIERICYARNGILSLLISETENRFAVFNLKKGKIMCEHRSDSEMSGARFDMASQNVLFGEKGRVKIFSLKYGRVVEALELTRNGSGLEENFEMVKIIFENVSGDKILVFSKDRVFEMKEDEGEEIDGDGGN